MQNHASNRTRLFVDTKRTAICKLALSACLLAACGSSNNTKKVGPRVEVKLDRGGGTLSSSGGVYQLEFPPGSIERDTTIRLTPIETPRIEGLLPGTSVELEPHGVDFASPIRLTIAFDPQAQAPEDEVHIVKPLEDGTLQFEEVAARSSGSITALLHSFSTRSLGVCRQEAPDGSPWLQCPGRPTALQATWNATKGVIELTWTQEGDNAGEVAVERAKIPRSEITTALHLYRVPESRFSTLGIFGTETKMVEDQDVESQPVVYFYRTRSAIAPRQNQPACRGRAGSSVAVEIEGHQEPERLVKFSVTPNGPGRIRSLPEGIDCGLGNTQCSADFDARNEVQLYVEGDNNTQLDVAWAGDCESDAELGTWVVFGNSTRDHFSCTASITTRACEAHASFIMTQEDGTEFDKNEEGVYVLPGGGTLIYCDASSSTEKGLLSFSWPSDVPGLSRVKSKESRHDQAVYRATFESSVRSMTLTASHVHCYDLTSTAIRRFCISRPGRPCP